MRSKSQTIKFKEEPSLKPLILGKPSMHVHTLPLLTVFNVKLSTPPPLSPNVTVVVVHRSASFVASPRGDCLG